MISIKFPFLVGDFFMCNLFENYVKASLKNRSMNLLSYVFQN